MPRRTRRKSYRDEIWEILAAIPLPVSFTYRVITDPDEAARLGVPVGYTVEERKVEPFRVSL